MKSSQLPNGKKRNHDAKTAAMKLNQGGIKCRKVDNSCIPTDENLDPTVKPSLNGNSKSSGANSTSKTYIQLQYSRKNLKENIGSFWETADRTIDVIIEISGCYTPSAKEFVFRIIEQLGSRVRNYLWYNSAGLLRFTMVSPAHESCAHLLRRILEVVLRQINSINDFADTFIFAGIESPNVNLYSFPDLFRTAIAKGHTLHEGIRPSLEKLPDGCIRPGYFLVLRMLQGRINYPELVAEYGVSESDDNVTKDCKVLSFGSSFSNSGSIAVKVFPIARRLEMRIHDSSVDGLKRKLWRLLTEPALRRHAINALGDKVRAILPPLILKTLLSIRDGNDLLQILKLDLETADINPLVEELRNRPVPGWLVDPTFELPSHKILVTFQRYYGSQKAAIIQTLRDNITHFIELASLIEGLDFKMLKFRPELRDVSANIVELVKSIPVPLEVIASVETQPLDKEVLEAVDIITRTMEVPSVGIIKALEAMSEKEVLAFLEMMTEPRVKINYSEADGFTSDSTSVSFPLTQFGGLAYWANADSGTVKKLEDAQIPTYMLEEILDVVLVRLPRKTEKRLHPQKQRASKKQKTR